MQDDDTREVNNQEFAHRASQISSVIRPHLAGVPYEVVGYVLAELLATFVRSFYPPSIRDTILSHHIEGVIAVIQAWDQSDTPRPH